MSRKPQWLHTVMRAGATRRPLSLSVQCVLVNATTMSCFLVHAPVIENEQEQRRKRGEDRRRPRVPEMSAQDAEIRARQRLETATGPQSISVLGSLHGLPASAALSRGKAGSLTASKWKGRITSRTSDRPPGRLSRSGTSKAGCRKTAASAMHRGATQCNFTTRLTKISVMSA